MKFGYGYNRFYNQFSTNKQDMINGYKFIMDSNVNNSNLTFLILHIDFYKNI